MGDRDQFSRTHCCSRRHASIASAGIVWMRTYHAHIRETSMARNTRRNKTCPRLCVKRSRDPRGPQWQALGFSARTARRTYSGDYRVRLRPRGLPFPHSPRPLGRIFYPGPNLHSTFPGTPVHAEISSIIMRQTMFGREEHNGSFTCNARTMSLRMNRQHRMH